MRFYILLVCFFSSFQLKAENFDSFLKEFNAGYSALNIPQQGFDYKEYFNSIPDTSSLQKQQGFFSNYKEQLQRYKVAALNAHEKLLHAHLQYEIENNLKRIALEREWVIDGRNIPSGGLYNLQNRKKWYQYFIKRYTSIAITPEEVYAMGVRETNRVQQEIKRIQSQLRLTDSVGFYTHLKNDSFYLHDKGKILMQYTKIDSTVRKNMTLLLPEMTIPEVAVMEWAKAGAFTPPGMYADSDDNAFGKDVFLFNFYNQSHNRRSMEWLYMHEAIPGHHLQSTFRRLLKNDAAFQHQFYYSGNFEGWACYVEYYGKEVGLYTDPFMELGKWEWDLVRSVRLVLDVGVHYYGWNYDKALAFWKQHIPGQNEIAQREITRITNWPAQALSYKVGADAIEAMKQNFLKANPDPTIQDFHEKYLRLSYFPLEVVKNYFDGKLTNERSDKEG